MDSLFDPDACDTWLQAVTEIEAVVAFQADYHPDSDMVFLTMEINDNLVQKALSRGYFEVMDIATINTHLQDMVMRTVE